MKKLLFLFALWGCFYNTVSEQNIVAGEYFWNTDPGIGLGTALNPSEIAGGIGDETFELNVAAPAGLVGQQILFVRFKLNDTLWSQAESHPIFISPENHLATAVNEVDSLELKEIEYFWNLESNPHATIWLPSSDESFNFTLNFPTAGAEKGANQLNFRFKDKYGLFTPWQSESILVLGRQSGELAEVDSIRYALSGYSYMGTPPNDFLNVNFNIADTLMRDSNDSSNVIGSREISTTSMANGIHVMTFKVFGSTFMDSSIVSSKNSYIYQTMVKVDNTIQMNVGTPTLVNGTNSDEFCPGGSFKIPIDTTGNWPEEEDYGIVTEFIVKIKNGSGQFLAVPTEFNTTGDSLIVSIPNDWSGSLSSKIMVEASFPLLRDTLPGTYKIGNLLTLNTSTPVVCVDELIQLQTTAQLNSTFSWAGPGGWFLNTSSSELSSTANRNASPTSGGIYTVTATSTKAGCVNIGTIIVTVNQLPDPMITGNSSVCEGQTLSLSSTANFGSATSWTKGGVLQQMGAALSKNNMNIVDAGYYKVTYTSENGCSGSDSVLITVKPNPVISGTSTNTPICSGQNLEVSVTATAGSTFAWSGPNSFSNTNNAWNISNSTTAASGTYSLTITLDGCTTSTTVLNMVNATPIVNTTSSVAVCVGSPLQINVNTTAGATYGWSGPNLFSSIAEDPQVSNAATLAMAGTYSVTVSLGTCSASGQVVVSVNLNPVLVISNQSAQQGSSVDLTLPAVIQGSALPPGTTLSYFTNAGATNILSNPNNVAVAGTYFIKAVTSSNCIDIKPVVVTICGGVFDPITAPIISGTVSNVSTQKITATNIISGTNTRVTYRSSVDIELQPGFRAENGTVFTAEIGGCI
jgi:hypothetical protein